MYTCYAPRSSGIPWDIPQVTCIFWYTHEPLAIENTVTNTINAKCALRMMGRLDVIPSNMGLSCVLTGCIFYDMPRESLLFPVPGITDYSARFSPFCNPIGASEIINIFKTPPEF